MIHRFIDEQTAAASHPPASNAILQIPSIRDVYNNMCYLRNKNIQQHRTIQMLRLALINERKKLENLREELRHDRAAAAADSNDEEGGVNFVKLCVYRHDRTFCVVTGQRGYVLARTKQLPRTSKRIVNTVTADAKLDCDLIVREAKKAYGTQVDTSKRRLHFRNDRIANEYQLKLQHMFATVKKLNEPSHNLCLRE